MDAVLIYGHDISILIIHCFFSIQIMDFCTVDFSNDGGTGKGWGTERLLNQGQGLFQNAYIQKHCCLPLPCTVSP